MTDRRPAMTSSRLVLEWLALLVLAVAAVIVLQRAGLTSWFDNRVLDYASALDRPNIDDRIVIVAIDDRSLEESGGWPWPREDHAAIIERLDAEGAALILYDVLFLEPSTAKGDARLEQALTSSGKVILPHTFVAEPNSEAGIVPVFPIDGLRSAALGVGHVTADVDDDGVLRRYRLAIVEDGQTYPHFAIAATDAIGETARSIRGASGEPPPTLLIAHDFPAAIPQISASDILAGAVPDSFLRNKIVLVGATAQGMGDRYSVASGSVSLMSGVETQANLVNALIGGEFITPLGHVWSHLVGVVALLALFLAFWFLPPRHGLIALFGLALASLALTVGLILFAGLWLPTGALLAVLLVAYPIWSWRRLSVVSAFLDRQARQLLGPDHETDRPSGFDYVSSQVARLRKLVREIRNSLEFLQNVIDAAPDAILVFGRDGRAVMRNDRADALFAGWSATDRPTMDELVSAAGAELQSEGREVLFPSHRVMALARETIDPEAAAGEVGEIVALRDVTEERQRQEERKQMLEFLSHDMRSPQAAIIGLTRESTADDEPSSGDSSSRLGRIRAQAERTLKLADDFVQLARLEQVPIAPHEVDICALAIEACDRFYTPFQSARLECDQDFPDQPVFAQVDESLVARALDNLIGNAIKFSPEGGRVRVAIITDCPGYASIEVRDQGPGLPPERAKDPFGRFGASDRTAGPSVGLGLAFVKRVADLHGATVDVRSGSQPGETGAAFILHFPLEGV